MGNFWQFSLLLVLAASACTAGLPRFARPTGGALDPTSVEGRDRIAYRELTPADFLAAAPPDEMAKYAERMGAVTCAHVFTSPDPQYVIEQTPDGFRGAYENLSFVARMDRECSWWNPKQGQVPASYVLQHEQIHFALAESAARRLDAQAKKIVSNLRPSGPTQESVERVLLGTVEELMADKMKALMKRNLEFDQDTSNTYAPEKQQEWFDQVMSELR